MTDPGGRVAAAYLEACLLELKALKPGNVHVFADGHGMTVAQFEASARASAPIMGEPGLAVGERIYLAVAAARAVADRNTNLGIVLLCAPLAQAALAEPAAALRDVLGRVLARLDVDDAAEAYAAIRLADPGGLGRSDAHDVQDVPTVTLLQAMIAARERDRIASQYANGYADIFDFGLGRLRDALRLAGDEAWATTAVYLGFLARFADSHIARKFGPARAEGVRRRAETLAAAEPAGHVDDLLRLDGELKAAGLNPGTSADLTVATLFAHRLERR